MATITLGRDRAKPRSGIHHIKSSDSKRRTFFDFRKP